MIIDVKVPQLSESVAEATLVTWHKKVGEAVTKDENLIDIETDKVVLERPSPADGVLVEIIRGNGDTVVAGELIARIDTEAQASVKAVAPESKPDAKPASKPESKPESRAEAPASLPPGVQGASSGIAMPAARKILEEKGVATADVAGAADVSPSPMRWRLLRPRLRFRRLRHLPLLQRLPFLPPPTRWLRLRPSRCRWPIVPSNACRCRVCARAWPSGWFSRNRPTPS